MNEELKRCSHCKLCKPLEQYYACSAKKDGKDVYCKSCRRAATAHYTQVLTEEQKERRKNQKIEYYLRKYDLPFQPYKDRVKA